MRPDRFFDAGQLQRLVELISRWRAALAVGESLSAAEQEELEALIEEELRAATERAQATYQRPSH